MCNVDDTHGYKMMKNDVYLSKKAVKKLSLFSCKNTRINERLIEKIPREKSIKNFDVLKKRLM